MSPIYIGSWFTQLLGYGVQLHATQVRIKFEIIWSLIKNIIVDFGSWRSYLWNSYTITNWINFYSMYIKILSNVQQLPSYAKCSV